MSLWIKLGWIRNRIPWNYHPSFAWLSVRVSQNSQWQDMTRLQFVTVWSVCWWNAVPFCWIPIFCDVRSRWSSHNASRIAPFRTRRESEGKNWGLNPGWTLIPGMFHDVSWDTGCFIDFYGFWVPKVLEISAEACWKVRVGPRCYTLVIQLGGQNHFPVKKIDFPAKQIRRYIQKNRCLCLVEFSTLVCNVPRNVPDRSFSRTIFWDVHGQQQVYTLS